MSASDVTPAVTTSALQYLVMMSAPAATTMDNTVDGMKVTRKAAMMDPAVDISRIT